MNKTILIFAFTAIASMMNVAHSASNGTLTFSGKLTDQTCSVVLNGGSSASGTVTLPTVQINLLTSFGNTAGKTLFTLDLSGCKASTTAFGITAYFPMNSYISSVTNTLFNQETGTTAAKNVNLELLQIDGATETKVPLGKPITDTGYKYTSVAVNATSATMNYAVQYKNTYTSAASTAGLVKGIAIYELAYQ